MPDYDDTVLQRGAAAIARRWETREVLEEMHPDRRFEEHAAGAMLEELGWDELMRVVDCAREVVRRIDRGENPDPALSTLRDLVRDDVPPPWSP